MLKTDSGRKQYLWYLIPLALFVVFAAAFPVRITNDSAQYIAMHIHRDPLYCLFLWVLRGLFGGNEAYLTMAVWLQNILSWVSVVIFTETVRREYKTGRAVSVIVCALALAPHILTPAAAKSGLILSNAIMSEALTLPMFYIWTALMLHLMEHGTFGTALWALVQSLLLAFVRGQMQICLIVWALAAAAGVVRRRRKVLMRTAAVIAAFVLSFVLKNVCTDTYDLIFNNYFHGTTFSEVSILTNVLYASDADAVECIDDPEAARFFTLSMEEMERQKLGYRYSSPGLLARGADIEAVHDTIKFKCIDEYWRPVHDAEYPELKDDYELETIEQDRIAGIILKDIFPKCAGRWLYDYLALCIYGFVRTVAFMHPVFMIYAALIYGFLILMAVLGMVRGHTFTGTPMLRLTLFTLLTVCGVVCGTASVIMCLSRYMIYVLPIVYTTVLLWCCGLVRGHLRW